MQMNESGLKAFTNGDASGIKQNLRVMLVAGKLQLAGAADVEIGTTETNSFELDETQTVRLRNVQGTRICIASGAIPLGSEVGRDAAGKVAVGTGYGTAMGVATADGDWIEILPF